MGDLIRERGRLTALVVGLLIALATAMYLPRRADGYDLAHAPPANFAETEA